MKKYSYIIFDGECGFCNKIIMFIARNDKNNTFKFISSLSELGTKILLMNKIKGMEKSTIILVENENEIYTKSLAIRKVLLKITYYKMVGYLMFLFPKKLSDYVYDLISKNRKLIIKNNIYEIPNSEIRKKFIM
jgi:predicted DCC family thiol-disulfide oxidoreductase YuxK